MKMTDGDNDTLTPQRRRVLTAVVRNESTEPNE